MFEQGDKVNLVIGDSKHVRTVLEIDLENDAVYLAEGGDCFYNSTGLVWGSEKNIKKIVNV